MNTKRSPYYNYNMSEPFSLSIAQLLPKKVAPDLQVHLHQAAKDVRDVFLLCKDENELRNQGFPPHVLALGAKQRFELVSAAFAGSFVAEGYTYFTIDAQGAQETRTRSPGPARLVHFLQRRATAYLHASTYDWLFADFLVEELATGRESREEMASLRAAYKATDAVQQRLRQETAKAEEKSQQAVIQSMVVIATKAAVQAQRPPSTPNNRGGRGRGGHGGRGGGSRSPEIILPLASPGVGRRTRSSRGAAPEPHEGGGGD